MAELFLDSLEIQNFRAFKHLKIEKLGRVNLIVDQKGLSITKRYLDPAKPEATTFVDWINRLFN